MIEDVLSKLEHDAFLFIFISNMTVFIFFGTTFAYMLATSFNYPKLLGRI